MENIFTITCTCTLPGEIQITPVLINTDSSPVAVNMKFVTSFALSAFN